MKVLVITNLAPTLENTTSGIFIVKRLEQYEKYGVDYRALSLGFKESRLSTLIRKILRKSSYAPLDFLGKVKFTPILIPRSITGTIMRKIGIINYTKYSKDYAREIENRFSVFEFDVIHAHGMYEIPAGEIAHLSAQKFNKPFVVTLHGSDVNLLMPKREKRYVEIFEKASKVIFVSNALLEKTKSFGYSGKNAVVIPNGYDPTIFKPMDKEMVRKELGIHKEGVRYVGFVGNLVPVKRADKFPEIFWSILNQMKNVRFIVVGDGELRKEIEKQTKGMDIIFTGRLPQEEVAKYMNAMDVMILPSRSEGFGAVCIEAQACGTCVVGSSNGGIPEAIGFEKYVVQEGEDFEERFARKVVEVLREGYDRDMLMERARKFTWEEIVRREVEVYEDVVFKHQ